MRALLLVLITSCQAEASARPWTATELFESTVQLHFEEARDCWKQPRIPGPRTIVKEIRGMLAASSRFWPGDEGAPYRLLAVMVSESGGNTRNTAKPLEPSYGPWCGTVDEAREAGRLFPDIGCPRGRDAIVERLQADPDWAAMVCGATLWRYDRAENGDQVLGLLIYKYGPAGLRRALMDTGKIAADLPVWRHYMACLTWIRCLRDRLICDSTPPCGCSAP